MGTVLEPKHLWNEWVKILLSAWGRTDTIQELLSHGFFRLEMICGYGVVEVAPAGVVMVNVVEPGCIPAS